MTTKARRESLPTYVVPDSMDHRCQCRVLPLASDHSDKEFGYFDEQVSYDPP